MLSFVFFLRREFKKIVNREKEEEIKKNGNFNELCLIKARTIVQMGIGKHCEVKFVYIMIDLEHFSWGKSTEPVLLRRKVSLAKGRLVLCCNVLCPKEKYYSRGFPLF